MSDARHYKITQRRDEATGKMQYWAMVDCYCGSTMSSGEWTDDAKAAVEAARAGIEEHEAKGQHCKPREGIQS